MKCKECKFCEVHGRSESQRGKIGRKHYYCDQPEVHKLKDSHGLPQNNFVGFGTNTDLSPLQLKTRPRWCPLKKVER
jgi:hypothetical protein